MEDTFPAHHPHDFRRREPLENAKNTLSILRETIRSFGARHSRSFQGHLQAVLNERASVDALNQSENSTLSTNELNGVKGATSYMTVTESLQVASMAAKNHNDELEGLLRNLEDFAIQNAALEERNRSLRAQLDAKSKQDAAEQQALAQMAELEETVAMLERKIGEQRDDSCCNKRMEENVELKAEIGRLDYISAKLLEDKVECQRMIRFLTQRNKELVATCTMLCTNQREKNSNQCVRIEEHSPKNEDQIGEKSETQGNNESDADQLTRRLLDMKERISCLDAQSQAKGEIPALSTSSPECSQDDTTKAVKSPLSANYAQEMNAVNNELRKKLEDFTTMIISHGPTWNPDQRLRNAMVR